MMICLLTVLIFVCFFVFFVLFHFFKELTNVYIYKMCLYVCVYLWVCVCV